MLPGLHGGGRQGGQTSRVRRLGERAAAAVPPMLDEIFRGRRRALGPFNHLFLLFWA